MIDGQKSTSDMAGLINDYITITYCYNTYVLQASHKLTKLAKGRAKRRIHRFHWSKLSRDNPISALSRGSIRLLHSLAYKKPSVSVEDQFCVFAGKECLGRKER